MYDKYTDFSEHKFFKNVRHYGRVMFSFLTLTHDKKIAVFQDFLSLYKGTPINSFRALPLFDEIIISIGINSSKNDYFSIQERVQWIENVFINEEN